MPTLARALGLPPGLTFKPEDDEIVELYLLPRASGHAEAITGVVIEEQGTGAAMPPWDLLARHCRTKDNEAYFFEPISEDDDVNNRNKDRSWTWVGQRRTPDTTLELPGGEKVTWYKKDLNLHRGRKRSGSTGWVMHEYIITEPKCSSPVKLCHVAFTGHGHKRQRLPDEGVESERVHHMRAASSSSEASATTFVDQQELLLPLEQDQERFLNQHTYGFLKQEQPPSFEGSSALTCWGSDAGSSQESCPGQQELAYDQQQSQDHDYEAYGALLAHDCGASQEPLPCQGQVLTQEQLFQQQQQQLLNNLLAASQGNNANNGERMIQMTEGTGMMPPLMDQGCLFDNLEDFCYVPPLDEDYYNGNMATGDGGGDVYALDGAFEDQSTQM